jgi:biopolymer transport protein ExbB
MGNLIHFFQAGGVVMWPLLLLSITAVAVIVERVLAFRVIGYRPPGLLKQALANVEAGRPEAAERDIAGQNGVYAACLRTALTHRRLAPSNIERAVGEVGEEQFTRLERFLPILDTTTTISPLLGLLGTLVGMIGTFQAIAAAKSQGANDQILAGVGEALYATATGLSIAVVCFVAYNYFAARQRHIVTETELAATKLLNALIAAGETGSESVHLDREAVHAG